MTKRIVLVLLYALIAAIYSHAYKSFAGNSRTVLVTGEQRAERRKSAWVKLAGKRWKETAFTNRKEADVSGWLMAWKTEWVKQIGGVPRTATEDYALGLKARLMGYGVEIANALAWGYGSNNPSDVLCEYTRYIRGMIQAKEEQNVRDARRNHPVFPTAVSCHPVFG